MELKEMEIAELEARKNAIVEETSVEGADLDALENEMRSINEELERRRAEEVEKAEKRAKIAAGAGEVIKDKDNEEVRSMKDIKEYRNSEEYMNLLAEAIKKENFDEVRAALLTTNATGGTIAVPDFVYDTIKTAWDKNEIMSLVDRVNVKGNLKVQFEISGSDAVIHTEGSGAVDEEELVEGIVTMVPANFKKWKSFSDEVMSLRGEAFLRYIYNELTYRIVKKIADQLVSLIAALPTTATATTPSADAITAAPAVGTIAEAFAHLSDEASNPVIIMNKLTYATFKQAAYANQYGVDPFEGLPVKYNNSLPAYSAATAGDVYAIVGDLQEGALANFPDGEEVKFTFDELTRKKEDLVEVLGKMYGAVAPISCRAFTNIKKPTEG